MASFPHLHIYASTWEQLEALDYFLSTHPEFGCWVPDTTDEAGDATTPDA